MITDRPKSREVRRPAPSDAGVDATLRWVSEKSPQDSVPQPRPVHRRPGLLIQKDPAARHRNDATRSRRSLGRSRTGAHLRPVRPRRAPLAPAVRGRRRRRRPRPVGRHHRAQQVGCRLDPHAVHALIPCPRDAGGPTVTKTSPSAGPPQSPAGYPPSCCSACWPGCPTAWGPSGFSPRGRARLPASRAGLLAGVFTATLAAAWPVWGQVADRAGLPAVLRRCVALNLAGTCWWCWVPATPACCSARGHRGGTATGLVGHAHHLEHPAARDTGARARRRVRGHRRRRGAHRRSAPRRRRRRPRGVGRAPPAGSPARRRSDDPKPGSTVGPGVRRVP